MACYYVVDAVIAASTGNQGIYDALVGLHVVCAVVGFGSVAVSGAYGAIARRPPTPKTDEETSRFFRSPSHASHLILAVPIFGLAALGFRPGGADYSAVWVVAGLVIWALAAGLLMGVVRPAEAVLVQAAAARASGPEPAVGTSDAGPEPALVRRAGTRMLWASAGSDVLFVVALGFMVTQAR